MLKQYMEKLSYKTVNRLLAVTVFILGAIWINMTMAQQVYDSYYVTNAANEFSSGQNDFFLLTEEYDYFRFYPFQLGYVFYLEILNRLLFIRSLPLIKQLLNVVCLDILYFTILGLVKQATIEKSIYIITALLMIIFIQPIMYVILLYGNIPGLMFGMLSVLNIIKYMKNRKKHNALLSSLFIGLACMVKLNSMIILVAVCIIFILYILRNKKWRDTVVLVLLVISGIGFNKLVILQYEIRSGEDLGEGIPIISWFAMGISEGRTAPGWYNEKLTVINFMDTDFNTEATSELANNYIKERLKYFNDNPGYMAEFFYKKFVSQWNEPTFECIFIRNTRGDYLEPSPISEYVYGEGEKGITSYMEYYQQFVYFGTVLGLFCFLKKKNIGNWPMAFLPLIILGGFFYHMLFEAKSQYIFTYFILMLPIAAFGLDFIYDIINSIIKRIKIKWRENTV